MAFIDAHPVYRQADVVIPAPRSNRDKPFDLPTELAELISQATGKPSLAGTVWKSRPTNVMKDLKTLAQKRDNVAGAYQVDVEQVTGRRVLLIDDIYDSGVTMNEVGRMLRDAGAAQVLGLVAEKTISY